MAPITTGPNPPTAAADVEQHVLRRGARDVVGYSSLISAPYPPSIPLTKKPITAPAISSAVATGHLGIDHHHDRGPQHVAEEREAAADPVGDLAERIRCR